MIKQNKKYAAFSMVELMISIFILSLITLTSVAVFANIVWARKNSLKISNDIETGREAIQIMAKNIRMSSNLDGNTSTIYFFSEPTMQCISYKFDTNAKILKSALRTRPDATDEDCSPGHIGAYSYNAITSTSMKAVGSFIVKKTDTAAKVVGSVTVVMMVDEKYSLQTTISIRNFQGII